VRFDGPVKHLPKLASDTPLDDYSTYWPLTDPGIVSDGYQHWLAVNNAASKAVILQFGGLGGGRTVYGPFDTSVGCS
jgi:hypothetical protein